MTIGGWILFGVIAFMIAGTAFAVSFETDGKKVRIVCAVIAVVLIAGAYLGMTWYFANTASGSRALIDQRSNLSNGMDRTITVYTADGHIIAQYSGRIDLEANAGGYVKFDYDGKRYIYYNCFIETIADIE